MLSENGDVIKIDTTRRQTGGQTLPCGFSLIRRTLYLACVTDELNHSRISDEKVVLLPRVFPEFSIIGSNWLLHMAVPSCTVIGRADLEER